MELVTFETAKLAKEKGFNLGCQDCFDASGSSYSYGWCERLDDFFKDQDFFNSEIEDLQFSEKYFTRPYQSQLQKWLREKHFIYVSVIPSYVGNDSKKRLYFELSFGSKIRQVTGSGYKETYEEALEEGLIQALKLIKKINHNDNVENTYY